MPTLSMDEVSCWRPFAVATAATRFHYWSGCRRCQEELFGQILDYRAHQIAISATH